MAASRSAAHASLLRNPADLAPAPADLAAVIAAAHAAADAITHIAAEDREAVRAAAADHRLYVPAFARTNAAVVRRRYRPASPSRADEILTSYDDAIEASTRVTSKLDDLASALDAPTWPLAALRAQSQRVRCAFQPGRTSAPNGSANSPARHRSIAAGSGPECGGPARRRPDSSSLCPGRARHAEPGSAGRHRTGSHRLPPGGLRYRLRT